MPEFERSHSETEAAGMDATRATARLPGLGGTLYLAPP